MLKQLALNHYKSFISDQTYLLLKLKETYNLTKINNLYLSKSFSSAPLEIKEKASFKSQKDTAIKVKVRKNTSINKIKKPSATTTSSSTTNIIPATPVVMNNTFASSSMPSIIKLTSINSLNSAKIGGEILKSGGVIATPTDTVYGLAADAQNIEAVERLYEIKGRNPEKPIAICLSQVSQLSKWANITVPNDLLHDLLPGPVTLVFERQPSLNPSLNPETNLIGIRIPNHTFIRQLAEEHGGPIALTSANRSSEPSTLSPTEFESLWPYIDCIFDGGHLLEAQHTHSLSGLLENQTKDEKTLRAGSTVINLSHVGYYSIIREGSAFKNSVQLLKDKYHLIEKK